MRGLIGSAVLGVGALGLMLGLPNQVTAQTPVVYGAPYVSYYQPSVAVGVYRPRLLAPRVVYSAPVVYSTPVYRSYVPAYSTYYAPSYYYPAPVTYYTPSYYAPPPVYVPGY
jgi:hypothetical protein